LDCTIIENRGFAVIYISFYSESDLCSISNGNNTIIQKWLIKVHYRENVFARLIAWGWHLFAITKFKARLHGWYFTNFRYSLYYVFGLDTSST